ncbi:hypothetical protein CEXT_122151 [Caerostris extrusa]|uniref:Uncharacterized protein n=1 Tax=Caerostris extrusa TaxID=172846 RepID=A0AAV4QKE6_CAEEX|nr:hypothetical protein CEXT_122151 [Caerostris extrusa]
MWKPSAFSAGHSNDHHAAAATLSSAGGEPDINGSIIRLTSESFHPDAGSTNQLFTIPHYRCSHPKISLDNIFTILSKTRIKTPSLMKNWRIIYAGSIFSKRRTFLLPRRHVIGHVGAICPFSAGHSNGHHAAAVTLSSAGGGLDINGSIIRLTSQVNDLRNAVVLLLAQQKTISC